MSGGSLGSTTAGLWDSVLRRSMHSGDIQRIQAAIDLAQSRGGGAQVLREGREELHRLANAALCDAAQKRDLERFAAAINTADEVGLPTAKLHEAKGELRELADSELQRVIELADVEELDKTISHIVKLGADPILLQNARNCLRQLRGEDVVSSLHNEGKCIIDVGASVDIDGGSLLEDAGWSDETCQGSSDLHEALSRQKTNVLGCSKPCLVAPMVIGRPLANIDMLEAGLSAQGVIGP